MPTALIVVVVFAAVIVITICAVTWTLMKRKRRAQKMSEAALTIGFSYEPDGKSLLNEGISEVSIFALATLRQCEILNLMRGRTGSGPVAICDCHYWTGGSSGSRFDHEQTVFCFPVKGGRLPDFTLRPRMSPVDEKMLAVGLKLAQIPLEREKPLLGDARRRILDTVMSETGDKGLEFPDHSDFSARYHVHASDRDAVRSLFHSGVVEFFGRQEKPLPSVEKAGDWLVVYRRNKLVRFEDLVVALDEARAIRALFPH